VNFIHERIKTRKIFGLSRNEFAVAGSASKNEDSERWRKCLQSGCIYRESMKNNNKARHFRRVHLKVKYGPSCYEKY